MAVGVDRLQLLNDAHGHAAGDALLVAMAKRLQRLARDGDTVCRYGEDVFVVALDGPATEITARAVARRIRDQLSDETYDIDGTRLAMTVTVGVAVMVPDVPAEIQIERATEDLRRAKEGKDGRRRHAPQALTTSARNRLQLQSALLGAAGRGEMWLAYQPIVELDSGRCVSIESLVRWNHPELGPVGPNDFIPAAEASGAITEIGAWVIDRACGDIARWRALPGHGDVIVSVNVAPFQLTVPSFAADVIAVLDEHGLPPTALAIEITERTLLASDTQEHAALEQLHGLGVRIAIDDFGTGYSALSLLTTVPGDALKLDRSFVTDIATNTKAKQVTASILGIANGLDMLAIAEGIETEEQRQTLIAAGYRYGQGYHFARPMPAEQVPDALSQAAANQIPAPAS